MWITRSLLRGKLAFLGLVRFIVVAAILIMANSLPAAASDEAEAKLKVAFIFNFTKFVTWPEPEFSAQPVITICLAGRSLLDDAFAGLKGKFAQGREVVVKRNVKSQQLAACHLVFICNSESSRLQKILPELGKGILTVSDIPEFINRGGAIGLSVTDNKVGFEVNLDAAQQADLRISAQLLNVARGVRGETKP